MMLRTGPAHNLGRPSFRFAGQRFVHGVALRWLVIASRSSRAAYANGCQILVSCEALRLGMGPSRHMAGLVRVGRVRRIGRRGCLRLSAEGAPCYLSKLRRGAVGSAHGSVLADRGTATLALGRGLGLRVLFARARSAMAAMIPLRMASTMFSTSRWYRCGF